MPSLEFSAIKAFAYRRNPDGTVDSICLSWFTTIATAALQMGLSEFEGRHQCCVLCNHRCRRGSDLASNSSRGALRGFS